MAAVLTMVEETGMTTAMENEVNTLEIILGKVFGPFPIN